MTYTTPTPSTVSAGDTFPASAYNIISNNLQDHEARIVTNTSNIATNTSNILTGVPSYTTTQKNALSGVSTGTVVYDSTLKSIQVWTGSAWVPFADSDNVGGLSDNAKAYVDTNRVLYRNSNAAIFGPVGANVSLDIVTAASFTVPADTNGAILVTAQGLLYEPSAGGVVTNNVTFTFSLDGATYVNQDEGFFGPQATSAVDTNFMLGTRRFTGLTPGSHTMSVGMKTGNTPVVNWLQGWAIKIERD